ncbi:hypothetical protein GCM10020229_10320 [Kitasatospora albolonga]|uniref:pentapeptide repeat-containing protein n=1 Tax=Kitasatospora albolonga TaxID=68173 RepID=UPI0031EB2CE8
MGSDLDLRGTTIDSSLLLDVLTACTDPATGSPRVGNANFNSVTFTDHAHFDSVTFTGRADFSSVTFASDADFSRVAFAHPVSFSGATFTSVADFNGTTFTSLADFGTVTFSSRVDFSSAVFTGTSYFTLATFTGHADFSLATFSGNANFTMATFAGLATFTSAVFSRTAFFDVTTFASSAYFDSATFEGLQHIGPLACVGGVVLDKARFTGSQVTIEVVTPRLSCERTAFEGNATLRLRYAEVRLSRAMLMAPANVHAWPVPFRWDGNTVEEDHFTDVGSPAGVRLVSLEGVDCAHLVLTDIDLSTCEFSGAFHLEQIRIGFGCRFGRPPSGWRPHHRLLPARWSPRKVLAEEQHWRSHQPGAAGRGWERGPLHGVPEREAGPDDLVGVYQQLRKAFEEAGNQPDAADFYYGEMEMRRHDMQRPQAERRLLGLYWLVSGYGLRASRALSLLLVAMGADTRADGAVRAPGRHARSEDHWHVWSRRGADDHQDPGPVLSLSWKKRVTAKRAEKAALVVVNSVVFRSSGQNLTLPGTVIEMASRIGEPVLLGLAALAIRSRVKR